jgi:hypothetical protein
MELTLIDADKNQLAKDDQRIWLLVCGWLLFDLEPAHLAESGSHPLLQFLVHEYRKQYAAGCWKRSQCALNSEECAVSLRDVCNFESATRGASLSRLMNTPSNENPGVFMIDRKYVESLREAAYVMMVNRYGPVWASVNGLGRFNEEDPFLSALKTSLDSLLEPFWRCEALLQFMGLVKFALLIDEVNLGVNKPQWFSGLNSIARLSGLHRGEARNIKPLSLQGEAAVQLAVDAARRLCAKYRRQTEGVPRELEPFSLGALAPPAGE